MELLYITVYTLRKYQPVLHIHMVSLTDFTTAMVKVEHVCKESPQFLYRTDNQEIAYFLATCAKIATANTECQQKH